MTRFIPCSTLYVDAFAPLQFAAICGKLNVLIELHPALGKEPDAGSLFGSEAVAAYANELGDLSKTLETEFTLGNRPGHAITPQWNARGYIGAYPADRASLFGGAARIRVETAAAHYRNEYASWTAFDEHLGQRYVHKHGGDQRVGWADAEHRTGASQAVYSALD